MVLLRLSARLQQQIHLLPLAAQLFHCNPCALNPELPALSCASCARRAPCSFHFPYGDVNIHTAVRIQQQVPNKHKSATRSRSPPARTLGGAAARAGRAAEAAARVPRQARPAGASMESWPFRRVFRVVSGPGGRASGRVSGSLRAPAQRSAPVPRSQGWWILCTATLCALPLTIWEFKNQGWSPHYQGAQACSGQPGARSLSAPALCGLEVAVIRPRGGGRASGSPSGAGRRPARHAARHARVAAACAPAALSNNSLALPLTLPTYPQPGSSAASL